MWGWLHESNDTIVFYQKLLNPQIIAIKNQVSKDVQQEGLRIHLVEHIESFFFYVEEVIKSCYYLLGMVHKICHSSY